MVIVGMIGPKCIRQVYAGGVRMVILHPILRRRRVNGGIASDQFILCRVGIKRPACPKLP